ncbi:MAG: D-alanyl-D-alanine carboxypeptidase/D-alanyl-D-alanine-endopeptidase [Actinomycetota bacterium]|nr:D-alanyl-D-alanine carboxypeptidase/D-alanyl-D-alanine-endopeptidase [Actinomycetota bacterium]
MVDDVVFPFVGTRGQSKPPTRPGRTRVGVVALALLTGVLLAPAVAANPIPPAGPVLGPTTVVGSKAPAPSPAGVEKATARVLASGALGAFSALVVDPATDQVLLEANADKARIPASTIKLLTAAAALEVLGPKTRLVTKVVRDGNTITLVGGGDTSLVRARGGDPLAGGAASLKALADLTAAALSDEPVQLVYDDSLFTGPVTGPNWPKNAARRGIAAPVSALMVGEGRVRPGALSRVGDPAKQAAEVFAGYLAKAGVEVAKTTAGKAASGATEIARVESPPVADLVEQLLTDSNNDMGESLAHLVGGATGAGASFSGGARAVTASLKTLGLPTTGLVVADGSGLSSSDRVSVETYGALLAAVARNTPDLSAIGSGLPVAGATGTLANRFLSGPTKRGAGYVHAKTGSLTGVIGLAGTVKDADGRVLVFSIIANDVKSLNAARNSVDLFATKLAKCGCSG